MSPIAKLALLILVLTALACSSSSKSMDSGLGYYDAEASRERAPELVAPASKATSVAHLSMPDPEARTAFIQDFDAVAAGGSSPTPMSSQRLLVYSGRFGVAVGDFDQALDATQAMAKKLGGYFQSLSDQTITIRVPASRWEEALARVAGIGRILNRQIDAADVTEEVVDLKLRLRNAKALGDRLEELLKLANTVEETLKVEKELNRVRTEIERLEGRLGFLSDRIAFSTLVIQFILTSHAPTRPQALPFPWLRALGLNNLLGLSGGVR